MYSQFQQQKQKRQQFYMCGIYICFFMYNRSSDSANLRNRSWKVISVRLTNLW